MPWTRDLREEIASEFEGFDSYVLPEDGLSGVEFGTPAKVDKHPLALRDRRSGCRACGGVMTLPKPTSRQGRCLRCHPKVGHRVPHTTALKTHCKRGHEFTPANTRTFRTKQPGRKFKTRRCRACASASRSKYRKAAYRRKFPNGIKRMRGPNGRFTQAQRSAG